MATATAQKIKAIRQTYGERLIGLYRHATDRGERRKIAAEFRRATGETLNRGGYVVGHEPTTAYEVRTIDADGAVVDVIHDTSDRQEAIDLADEHDTAVVVVGISGDPLSPWYAERQIHRNDVSES